MFSEFEITPRLHTRFLPDMMNSVLTRSRLKKPDITHISYASGPGAFTGVRIAASTAQGIAIGLNCPLVPVSTLAVLAQKTSDTYQVNKILATLDARMGEAYIATYQTSPETRLVELEGEEQLLKLDQLHDKEGYFLAGSGFRAKREAGFGKYDSSIDEEILPHAEALVILAKQAIQNRQLVSAGKGSINYIRNKVAEKKKPVKL